MTKVLIMTEGSDELAFLEVALDKGLLKYKKTDLLYEEIIHARQIREDLIARIQQLDPNVKIKIVRVGDKLSDKLRIPKEIKRRVIDTVDDYCTTPEFEILMIINEGLFEAFDKTKSKRKPSEFYMAKHPDYHKSKAWVADYFESLSIDELTSLLKEYEKKRGQTIPCGKNSIYLLFDID